MNLLQTQRLILRGWEMSDTQALIKIADQEYVNNWLPDWLNSTEWVDKWIPMVQQHYVIDNPMTNFLSWAVTLADSGLVVGQINIGSNTFHGKEIGIGYFIDENYSGRGYTTEATINLIKYVFERYEYDHIAATVQPKNYASIVVVEKAGFQYIKTIEIQDNGQTEVLLFRYYRLKNNFHIKEE